jgi:hypothetical protein
MQQGTSSCEGAKKALQYGWGEGCCKINCEDGFRAAVAMELAGERKRAQRLRQDAALHIADGQLGEGALEGIVSDRIDRNADRYEASNALSTSEQRATPPGDTNCLLKTIEVAARTGSCFCGLFAVGAQIYEQCNPNSTQKGVEIAPEYCRM